MRYSTASVKSFLDGWSPGTGAQVADLYTFTLITGEVFRYSGFQTPLVAELPVGMSNTTATVPTGSITLPIAIFKHEWQFTGSSPLYVYDVTTPGAIPANTIVVSKTDFTVTLSNATTAPMGNNELLSFRGYYNLGPRFSRTKTKTQVGPQIDEIEIDIFVGETDDLGFNAGGNLTWQKAFWSGIFDGALCELDRAFINFPQDRSSPPAVVGSVVWFYGRVSDVVVGRTRIVMKVKSLLDLLTIQMPRRLFQASCGWIFGRPFGCGYDRVNGLNAAGVSTGIGQVAITCQTGSSQNVIKTTFVPSPSDIYDNGSIVGVTGLNAGFTRTIGRLDSSTSPGTIYFLKPFIFPVVANTDTFNLLPGCNHTQSRCADFNNSAQFGGFPFIPPPETAI